MNFVLQSGEQSLVSLDTNELHALTNALNEICNGVLIPESEFQTRLGANRAFIANLLQGLSGEVHASRRAFEVAHVWADQSSVMVQTITAFGDPVEMGETEAEEFARQLAQAIKEAS